MFLSDLYQAPFQYQTDGHIKYFYVVSFVLFELKLNLFMKFDNMNFTFVKWGECGQLQSDLQGHLLEKYLHEEFFFCICF